MTDAEYALRAAEGKIAEAIQCLSSYEQPDHSDPMPTEAVMDTLSLIAWILFGERELVVRSSRSQ